VPCWPVSAGGLPRSESGAAFAGRAHHAAAALLPPIASIYIGAGAASGPSNSANALRSAPIFCAGFSGGSRRLRTRLVKILHSDKFKLGIRSRRRRRVVVGRVRWRRRRRVREKLQRQGSEPRMPISGGKISIEMTRPTAPHHMVYFRKRRQRGPHATSTRSSPSRRYRRNAGDNLSSRHRLQTHRFCRSHCGSMARHLATKSSGSTLIMLLVS
jgi:hypothetical protein